MVKQKRLLRDDTYFMLQAFKQAEKASVCDEIPIGSVVVDAQRNIIGRGYNQTEKHMSQTAHAELQALAQASKKIFTWRLYGCWVYVTLEPCVMCMAAIVLSRCEGIVFATSSPLFGFHLDKDAFSRLYNNGILEIRSGIAEQKSRDMLRQFFQKKRNKKGERSKN